MFLNLGAGHMGAEAKRSEEKLVSKERESSSMLEILKIKLIDVGDFGGRAPQTSSRHLAPMPWDSRESSGGPRDPSGSPPVCSGGIEMKMTPPRRGETLLGHLLGLRFPWCGVCRLSSPGSRAVFPEVMCGTQKTWKSCRTKTVV